MAVISQDQTETTIKIMLGQEFSDEITRLLDEAEYCYETIVLPNWCSEKRHGFPDILFGLVMGVMTRVDIISQHFDSSSLRQTPKMVSFLNKYVKNDDEFNTALIQIWRHQLMHTSAPREVIDESTNIKYLWLLHWKEHLPIEQHYTFIIHNDTKILNVGLIYLIKQLKVAIFSYLTDLNSDCILQANYKERKNKLEIIRKKIT